MKKLYEFCVDGYTFLVNPDVSAVPSQKTFGEAGEGVGIYTYDRAVLIAKVICSNTTLLVHHGVEMAQVNHITLHSKLDHDKVEIQDFLGRFACNLYATYFADDE
jgi:hypothetical protein